MNWKIIIAIIFFTILINYAIHQTSVNQAREIREQCLTYVEEQCACKPERIIDYNHIINNNWNNTIWNTQK